MAYFTAALAKKGARWSAPLVDVDSVSDGSELADVAARLQLAAEDNEPILLLIEREDTWWAVLRIDGDDDPRVFVSDVEGVARTPYAGLVETGVEPVDGNGFGGDLDVLSDFGTSPEDLRQMCEEELVPMDAMAAVAEAAGFAEVLDSLR